VARASRAAVALGLLLLLTGGSAGAAEGDILGPLGPLPWPQEAAAGLSAQRLLAGAVAVGFVAFGFYYLLRRRGRRRAAPTRGAADLRSLAGRAGELPDAEFYTLLLSLARRSLGDGAASLTPRELAGRVRGGREWREACLRAEAAQYGRASYGPARRRSDAELARRVVATPGAADPTGGG
jgi:hypothetical protein